MAIPPPPRPPILPNPVDRSGHEDWYHVAVFGAGLLVFAMICTIAIVLFGG